MSEIITSFARTEYKYMLSPGQYAALRAELSQHFEEDSYGVHTICNIFYDTDTFDVIRHSIDKPIYKEKLRLRSYGVPESGSTPVFLELKKKYNHTVYKRRISAPLEQLVAFASGGDAPAHADPQITAEIRNFLRLHHPSPKVFLCYDRQALFCPEDPDLRITFDRALKWRNTDLDLRAGSDGAYIIPAENVLMEIKFSQAMPLWLVHLLSALEIRRISFSKIGTCYKQNLIPVKNTEKDVSSRV